MLQCNIFNDNFYTVVIMFDGFIRNHAQYIFSASCRFMVRNHSTAGIQDSLILLRDLPDSD